jgi:uncharacterized protein
MTTLLWEEPQTHSLEYFTLTPQPDKFALEGTILLLLENQPTQVRYRIEADRAWKTRTVEIDQLRPGEQKRLTLIADRNGNWHSDGALVPFASGRLDVDLEISPSTNTLHLNRGSLREGDSLEVNAVWVRFPSLTLEPLHQRYTRLSANLYAYDAPYLDFETQIEVDDRGLVTHYHGLWKRVTP